MKRKQIKDKPVRRAMTADEKEKVADMLSKEKARYEESKKIGGIDELGNYTALHHR